MVSLCCKGESFLPQMYYTIAVYSYIFPTFLNGIHYLPFFLIICELCNKFQDLCKAFEFNTTQLCSVIIFSTHH